VGYEVHGIACASISGTYLEASAHLLPGGCTIAALTPDQLICQACIARIPKLAGERITREEVRAAARERQPGDALIVATGWDRHWARPNFVEDSPHFTPEAMAWICEQRVPILGGDMPCFDDPRSPVGLNQMLFASGALILAPLVNLGEVRTSRVILFAFPLKIVGSSGSPCRAIAVEASDADGVFPPFRCRLGSRAREETGEKS